MKVLAFGASSSKNSINQKLAVYTAELIPHSELNVLDLNDYEMPIYSIDKEKEIGIPNQAHNFIKQFDGADVIVISFAEHNGSYTSAFKNIFDWASRVKLNMFEQKKLVLLSTSHGPRGGLTVLDIARDRFPRHGGDIVGVFALPQFKDNFKENEGIINIDLKAKLDSILSNLNHQISNG